MEKSLKSFSTILLLLSALCMTACNKDFQYPIEKEINLQNIASSISIGEVSETDSLELIKALSKIDKEKKSRFNELYAVYLDSCMIYSIHSNPAKYVQNSSAINLLSFGDSIGSAFYPLFAEQIYGDNEQSTCACFLFYNKALPDEARQMYSLIVKRIHEEESMVQTMYVKYVGKNTAKGLVRIFLENKQIKY